MRRPKLQHEARSRRGRVARTVASAFASLCVLLAALVLPGLATAEAPPIDEAGAPADAEAPLVDAGDAAAPDPAIAHLHELAQEVRDLVKDRLAIDVEPQTLFDVSLDDDAAIGLEAVRLRALLRDVDLQAARAKRDASAKRGPRDASPVDASVGDVPPSLWQARVDLDRARLSFYALPRERRTLLLTKHAARRQDAAPAASKSDDRAKEAEEERAKALQAARDARTEAERLVSEEYARLLDVEAAQAAFEKKLATQRQAIAARREATLGWQRRAREARGGTPTPEDTDQTYDELRKALRGARDDLSHTLDDVSRGASDVPHAGPDPLTQLPKTVDAASAREERKRVETAATRLVAEEKILHDDQASQLLHEIDTLNGERLALLPHLSASKRASITGFTAAGADQAASELRQLSLIARYHQYAAAASIRTLRAGGKGVGLSLGGAVLVALEWLVALGIFIWVKRRVPQGLHVLWKRARANDRYERLESPSLASRVLRFALEVHTPVEWLGFAVLLSWLLPDAAQNLLEVQLVTVIVEWVLGGSLVVVVVNALAEADHRSTREANGAPALRLRSLRLVGRVVVAFGLILVLTSRLVGPGTIYQWVLSTCWFASIPVFLVLVRWWRGVVFERAERARKKTAFEKWVLANRAGWKSFLAATGGGVYLFARGSWRAGRSWLGRFNVTRSVLAYLFRRELGKLEAERADLVTARLPNEAFNALGPEVFAGEPVKTDVDEEIARLSERLRERRGGVIALVGSFGMGKSLLLERLHDEFPDTLLMTAPEAGEPALRAQLGERVGLDGTASLDTLASALASSESSRGFLLDDAQRFVRPLMGGLATFDALLAAASRHSTKTTWVFALDEVIWLFLRRARAARPLFDEVIRLPPWREEQIVKLLCGRTEAAGLHPSFERLLDKLPSDADEIDKREALEQRAASYYRLLWDYAAGNPGIALHMWRRSLGADADGGTHVRFFQAPDATDLELLPDQAVFVLRAVLQLEPVTKEEIARATNLTGADITDALRYARGRTYVTEEDGRYRVTWTWRRAISLFLQRRHLLVTP